MILKNKIIIGTSIFIFLLLVAIFLSYLFENQWIWLIYVVVSALIFGSILLFLRLAKQTGEDTIINEYSKKKKLSIPELADFVYNYCLTREDEWVAVKKPKHHTIGERKIVEFELEGYYDYRKAKVLVDSAEPEETITILDDPTEKEVKEAINSMANVKIEKKIIQRTTDTPSGTQTTTSTEEVEKQREKEIEKIEKDRGDMGE